MVAAASLRRHPVDGGPDEGQGPGRGHGEVRVEGQGHPGPRQQAQGAHGRGSGGAKPDLKADCDVLPVLCTWLYLSARTWWYQGLADTKHPNSAKRSA